MDIKGLRINERFQKSINIKYDLQNVKKITNYIPTTVTMNLINQYINDLMDDKAHRASALVGPYGKGKSQLLLTMLGVATNYKSEEIETLISRLSKVDDNVGKTLKLYREKRYKYLPVIISNKQNNFNQAILLALIDALKTYGLNDAIPKTSYQAAIDKIQQWKNDFPETYMQFVMQIDNEEKLIRLLKNCDEDSFKQFCDLHINLTSGSEFNPLINMDITNLLIEVGKAIKEKYKYNGIFLVFDEYTKYLESADEDNITNELNIIQDICELPADNDSAKIYSVYVMHKRISEYTSLVSEKTKKAFKGIEGRVEYREITSTAKNNYELIMYVLEKINNSYNNSDINERYDEVLQSTSYIPAISSVFITKKEQQSMVDGCYPLTPLTATCLLRLSERVAQNERSLFTFLASREDNGLIDILNKSNDVFPYITIDKIYDYFVPLIEKNAEEVYMHNIYLKLQYALSKSNEEYHPLLKALAVIHMINDFDNIPANHYSLENGLLLKDNSVIAQLRYLTGLDLLREKRQMFYFKTENVIDLEKLIENKVGSKYANIKASNEISDLIKEHYVVSRRYNNEFKMTRYFEKVFMSIEEFNVLPSIDNLYDKNKSDGKLIYLLPSDTEINLRNTDLLNENARTIVVLPKKRLDFLPLIKRIKAIREIMQETKNTVEINELQIFLDDAFDDFYKIYNNVYYAKDTLSILSFDGNYDVNNRQLDRIMYDMLTKYYNFTPIINYELINKEVISGAYAKAREVLISHIIKNDYVGLHKGTSAESSIYRTTLSNLGLANNEDKKELNPEINLILEEIGKLLNRDIQTSHTFEDIYSKLTGIRYGMRKGVIPIYLAYAIVHSNLDVILYYKDQEIEMNEHVFNLINNEPDQAKFRVEVRSHERKEYENALFKMFDDYNNFKNRKYSRQKELYKTMQSWYNYLPKISKMTDLFEKKEENKRVKKLLKMLSKYDNNSSDFIYFNLPKLFDSDYKATVNELFKIKRVLENHIIDVKANVEKCILKCIGESNESDLVASIKMWFEPYRKNASIASLSSTQSALVNCLSDASSLGKERLIDKIALVIIGNYIEDWDYNTINDFELELKKAIEVIKNSNDKDELGDSKIVISNNEDILIEKTFDDTTNPIADVLFNELDDLLDQYGDSLELSDKLAVLTKLIKNIVNE